MYVAFFAFLLLPGYVQAFAPLDIPVTDPDAAVLRLHLLGAAFMVMSAWMCWALVRTWRPGRHTGRSIAVCMLLEAALLTAAVIRGNEPAAVGTATALLLIALCHPRLARG